MTMKRMTAPVFWPIERKTKKYVMDPMPGPHSKQASIPLGVVLRDILRVAYNRKEAVQILTSGKVLVDGRPRKETNFSVGLMDVVTVGDESYRVVTAKKGLKLVGIDKKGSETKLFRVEGKNYLKKGRVQVHLHDGSNMLEDGKKYRTGDVIVYDIAKRSVKEVIKMEKGIRVLIIEGSNSGTVGTVEEVIVTKGSLSNQVALDIGTRKITLPQKFVFALGKNESVLNLGGGA